MCILTLNSKKQAEFKIAFPVSESEARVKIPFGTEPRLNEAKTFKTDKGEVDFIGWDK